MGAMKCPKDANHYFNGYDEESRKLCLSRITIINREWRSDGTWKCTRKKNHKGKHHAHKGTEKCYRIWVDEEAVIEAL